MKSENKKKDSIILKDIFNKINVDEARLLSKIVWQDPFVQLYKKAIIIYAFILFVILLCPFEFNFNGKINNVKWSDDSPGIDLVEEGQVISRSVPIQFFDELTKSDGLSIEAWITPQKNNFIRPSRIISYSLNRKKRNFTMAQQGSKLLVGLRTEKTNLNGTEPMLIVENIFNSVEPIHIVISYNYQEQRVYVNGSLNTTSIIPGGDFRNWDPEYPLIFGNEATGNCPWLGKISYVAIYNRPLDAQEVRSSYLTIKSFVSDNVEIAKKNKGLIVRYLFSDKKGSKVTDTGTLSESLTLTIPDKIQTEGKPFLGFSIEQLKAWGTRTFSEIFSNVLLFVPLGFLFYSIIARHIEEYWIAFILVVIVGGATSLIAEILQYFIESRYSTSVDIISNLIGTILGVNLKCMYDNFLIRNKRGFCEL